MSPLWPAPRALCPARISVFGMRLFRIEPERLELPAPFGWRIAEPLDADATGQAAFDGCFDKIWCEEGERDGHIDLTNTALFAHAKFGDVGYSTGDHIIQPAPALCDGADQASAALELFRPGITSGCVMREQDAAGFFGWRLQPRDCERGVV
jgi:hypothetical protein